MCLALSFANELFTQKQASLGAQLNSNSGLRYFLHSKTALVIKISVDFSYQSFNQVGDVLYSDISLSIAHTVLHSLKLDLVYLMKELNS